MSRRLLRKRKNGTWTTYDPTSGQDVK